MILDLVIINKVFSFLGLTYSARIEDLKLYLKKISLLNSRVWVPSKENFCEMIFSFVYIIFSFVTCITSINFASISVSVTWPFYYCFVMYLCIYLSIYLSLYVFMYVCVYACMCVFIYEFIHEFILPWKESLLMKYSWTNRKKAITRRLVCNI